MKRSATLVIGLLAIAPPSLGMRVAAHVPCEPVATVTSPGGAGAEDGFGTKVGLGFGNSAPDWYTSLNRLFVSAPTAAPHGAIYEFASAPGTASWTLVESVVPAAASSAGMVLRFGSAMDVGRSSTTVGQGHGIVVPITALVIGAPGDDQEGTDAGIVYVKRAPYEMYALEVPPSVASSTRPQLGTDVAIGNTGIVVAGAPFADSGPGVNDNIGAAFVLEPSSLFTDLADLLPGPLPAGAAFGYRVAIDGPRVAVASPGERRVHLFNLIGGQEYVYAGWIEIDSPLFQTFMDISLRGDDLVVAWMWFFGENWLAANVFHWSGSAWVDQTPGPMSFFSAELGDDRFIAAGWNDYARIFQRDGAAWFEATVLDPPAGYVTDVDLFEELAAVGTGAPRAVHVYGAPLSDCNLNCIDDASEIAQGLALDCQGDGVPDDCQSDEWIAVTGDFHDPANWSRGIVPVSEATISNAQTGAPSVCVLSQSIDVCTVVVDGSPGVEQRLDLQLGAGTLAVGTELSIEPDGTLAGAGNVDAAVFNNGAIKGGASGSTLTIDGPLLHNAPTGLLQASPAVGSQLVVSSSVVAQLGQLVSPADTTITFAAPLTNEAGAMMSVAGTVNIPSGSNNAGTWIPMQTPTTGIGMEGGMLSLDAGQKLTNSGTIIGSGDLRRTGSFAPVVLRNDLLLWVTGGDMVIDGTTENCGTIVVDAASTLYIRNALITPSGCAETVIGTIDLIPSPSMFGTLDVAGDVELGPAATIDVPGGHLRVTGDVRIQVDDPQRFDMATATLQLDGIFLFGTQELELLADDAGEQYDPDAPPPYFIGAMELGPNPAAVRLVDPTASGHVLYVGDLAFAPGTTLDLAGHIAYAAAVTPADYEAHVTDSVGGGALVILEAVDCPEDLDGNGAVGFADLLAVLSSWGPCPGCPADFDGNGAVGFGDLLAVLSAWGPCAE